MSFADIVLPWVGKTLLCRLAPQKLSETAKQRWSAQCLASACTCQALSLRGPQSTIVLTGFLAMQRCAARCCRMAVGSASGHDLIIQAAR